MIALVAYNAMPFGLLGLIGGDGAGGLRISDRFVVDFAILGKCGAGSLLFNFLDTSG